jgi:hypothetical protein
MGAEAIKELLKNVDLKKEIPFFSFFYTDVICF